MICELQIKFFFHPFGILWYKFLSYIEVLCVLSEFSKLLELSELIEPPEVFSSMKKCLFHGALRLGDPLIKPLELRFVSSSSETSQSSISSHPVFPDVVLRLCADAAMDLLSMYRVSGAWLAFPVCMRVLSSVLLYFLLCLFQYCFTHGGCEVCC